MHTLFHCLVIQHVWLTASAEAEVFTKLKIEIECFNYFIFSLYSTCYKPIIVYKLVVLFTGLLYSVSKVSDKLLDYLPQHLKLTICLKSLVHLYFLVPRQNTTSVFKYRGLEIFAAQLPASKSPFCPISLLIGSFKTASESYSSVVYRTANRMRINSPRPNNLVADPIPLTERLNAVPCTLNVWHLSTSGKVLKYLKTSTLSVRAIFELFRQQFIWTHTTEA